MPPATASPSGGSLQVGLPAEGTIGFEGFGPAMAVPRDVYVASGGHRLVAGEVAEDVALAVERRHYPDLPPPSGMGVSESLWAALRFGTVAVLLNLLAA